MDDTQTPVVPSETIASEQVGTEKTTAPTPARVEPPAETEVQVVARAAAVAVPGVHALGTQTRRRLASALGRVSGSRTAIGAGVNAETGTDQTAIDLAVVVEYGVVIPDVSREVRRAVTEAVGTQTHLEVVEVNVDVIDVYLPGDPEPGEPEPQPEPDTTAEPTVEPDTAEPVDTAEPASADDDRAEAPVLVDPPNAEPAAVPVQLDVSEPVTVTETVVTTTVIEPGTPDTHDDSSTGTTTSPDDRS